MKMPTDEELDKLEGESHRYVTLTDEVLTLINALRSAKVQINEYEQVLSSIAAMRDGDVSALACVVLSKEF